MRYLYNDRQLRDRRRELRKNMTEAEALLWSKVRMRKMKEYKFLRQYSVGPYILDFFCVALQLGIEVDGQFHGDKANRAYDRLRSDFLINNGITLIRFWNAEVIKDLFSVVAQIEKYIATIEHSPSFHKVSLQRRGDLEGL